MQKNTKITIIVSIIIAVFAFVIIGIVYQYFRLNKLTEKLQNNKKQIDEIYSLTQETQKEIEKVETNEYIEKWARSELDWSKEHESRIVY